MVLVMDHRNTHMPASLYEAFEPAEALRLLERLEMHDTPKHGSWLNMAETDLSVLATPCLDRRIAADCRPDHGDPGACCLGTAAQ
jgi:DDE superfamily endonuclease